MRIDDKELFRYLGVGSGEPDDETRALAEEAKKLALAAARPRHVLWAFAYSGGEIEGAGFTPEGKDIARHLEGSREVWLLAATLGSGIEREEARLFARSAALALVFDSAASCLIESYCDDVCAELAAKSELPLTPRFSCGYGDFPLTAQEDICRALDTARRIGVVTDASGLLIPRKSVTALIGAGGRGAGAGCGSKCERCGNVRCAFRKA